MSFNDKGEENVMHSKDYSIEIINNDKVDEVIEERFRLFLSRYQIEL